MLVAGTGGVVAAGITATLLHTRLSAPQAAGPRATPRVADWQDLYRQTWTWDAVKKGTHGWLNCRSACTFDLYIKNGVVVREEQSGTYGASEPGVPDFNPRGCQKGACYTEVMYGPSRLTVPLVRDGERGSGRWRQVTWEEAIEMVATAMVDTAERYGTEAVVHDLGPHFDQGPTTLARTRFFHMFGATMPDDWGEIGDLNTGATLTFGFPHVGGSSDEWFLSDFLVVWMMNPSVTQIPDAHFLFEARYKGADLIVIAPEYSATAVHADLWLPVRPGSDAALALAVARHLWWEGYADWTYVREQTDLPLLVRLDSGRFLRGSDLEAGGKENMFFAWDPAAAAPVPASGCPGSWQGGLGWVGVEPALEGTFAVTLADGSRVEVAPVGELLKRRLEPWTFAAAAAATGLSEAAVARFASAFAAAKRPMVLSSWGSNRYLHSDLMNRAKILCLALKGAIGKRGAGYHSTGWVAMEGFEAGAQIARAGQWGFYAALLDPERVFGDAVNMVARRKTLYDLGREVAHSKMLREMCATNSASLNYNHQGIAADLAVEQDALQPRPLDAYVREAQAKDWMPVYPRPEQPPKIWITGGNNVLRRSNLPQRMLETLWPQLDLVVDINQKLTFTGMHADVLLPAAGYYEKPNFKYPVAYIPYLHYGDAAVPPVGEAKDEWEIMWLLAAAVQRIARERGLTAVPRCGDLPPVDLTTLAERFSFQGHFGPKDAEGVAQQILDLSSSCRGMEVRNLKHTGIARYTGTGITMAQSQLYNPDWDGTGILRALTYFSEHKRPWPTQTGRQQFYIDHPWFLETGEHLPLHKPSPKAGGEGRFQFVSCHSRWSVHSVFRDTALLLRLQRGEPVFYLNPETAQELGIADGAWAELSNRYGSVRMRCKHSVMVGPEIIYYFHAWEPYQFPHHQSYKWLIPGLINPLHFAGGEGHLGWRFAVFQPGTHVQDTRVDVRPVAKV